MSLLTKGESFSQKKTGRSTQAQTEEKQLLRIEYWQKIRDVDPSNLVFLDESGAHLGLNRTRGRCLRGQRADDSKPFYHGKKITMIGAITINGLLAIQTLDHCLKGEDFRIFVKEKLLPLLWSGAVVVMDNLPAHKVLGIEELIASVGARVVYLSPYSPEFNPIEHLWSQGEIFLPSFCPQISRSD